RPAGTTTAANTIIGSLDPKAYYGLASDFNRGSAAVATLGHIHRFDGGAELKTQLRHGRFDRDLRPSVIRFAGTTVQPAVFLSNFGPGTVFTRGGNPKIQDVEVTQLQSDYSAKVQAWGMRHELMAGFDSAIEKKAVYAASGLTKPTTLAGTPNDGAWVDESSRTLRTGSQFEARAWGVYAQDLVQVAPAWKLLGGLRYDSMKGNYDCFSVPSVAPGCGLTSNVTANTTTNYRQNISEWSQRLGALYQPDALHSYHVSYGTSFNTSGDTYSYNPQNANTPPESSANFELGAKVDSADKRFTTRLALFHSTKKNERNTDTDTAATRLLLSGQRHTAGFEIDLTGRLTPKWEVYGSYTWMPIAKVDKAAPCPATGGCLQGTVGNQVGDRPGLSPKHSGTVWTTYQFTPQWRLGGGLNFRSAQAPADVTAPAWEAPSFVTADLMAEYTISQQYVVKANLSNITNKLYGESLYRGHYIPGAGRMLQVALTAKF
ncbi:MAG TPA: TonB-dependent receptor, partial [Ramlibacter sp.]|nr:TonB-dependent receptor [Ramlibacter sp.]